MTKLCPRGKAAAKRKFKVYPSAYANAYASKICAGKIKDPSGVKRKDFRGPKPAGKAKGGRIGFREGAGSRGVKPKKDYRIGFELQGDYKGKNLPERALEFVKTAGKQTAGTLKKGVKQNIETFKKVKEKIKNIPPELLKMKSRDKKMGGGLMAATERLKRQGKMGGGMMRMPRAMYGKGGGVCKRGMGRAYGKNS